MDADRWIQKGVQLYDLGVARREHQYLEEAAQCMREALSPKSTPTDEQRHRALSYDAIVKVHLGAYPQAISVFKEALKLRLNCAILFDLVLLLIRMGDLTEVVNIINAALPSLSACHPRDVANSMPAGLLKAIQAECERFLNAADDRESYENDTFAAGVNATSSGNFDLAADLFAEILKTDPKNSMAWNNRADALVHIDQCELAYVCVSFALIIDQGNYAAWCTLGEILHKQDLRSEALACFERSFMEAPQRDQDKDYLESEIARLIGEPT